MLVINLLVFIASTVFNGLRILFAGESFGYLSLSSKDSSFSSTPLKYVYYTWEIIWLWLLVCFILLFWTFFIKYEFQKDKDDQDSEGEEPKNVRLYMEPMILTPSVTVTLSMSSILTFAWMFLEKTFELDDTALFLTAIWQLPAIFLNFVTSWCLCSNISENSEKFNKRGTLLFRIGILYKIVCNGSFLYTIWTAVAFFLNLMDSFVANGGDQEVISLILLVLIFLLSLTYILLDCFYIHRNIR